MSVFEAYTNTAAKDLQKMFGKSPQAVSNGIARMLERNPDHPEWKYKDGNRVMIQAAGVEWLAGYFRQELALVAVDDRVKELEKDLKHANEMIAQAEKYTQKLEENYRERLAEQAAQAQQTFLIEQESKQKQIERLEQEKADQAARSAAEIEALKKELEIERNKGVFDKLKEKLPWNR